MSCHVMSCNVCMYVWYVCSVCMYVCWYVCMYGMYVWYVCSVCIYGMYGIYGMYSLYVHVMCGMYVKFATCVMQCTQCMQIYAM